MKSTDADFDVLLRYSPVLFEIGNPIEQHREVLNKQSFVWFGKFGRPLATSRMNALNAMIDQGRSASLYLASKSLKQWAVFRCNITKAQPRLTRADLSMVPKYYVKNGLMENAGSWFALDSIRVATPETLDRMRLVNTGSTAREALRYSANGVFFIRDS